MRVLQDCWDDIGAADCDFGTYLFKDSTATIYVHDGLDVGAEMSSLFCRKSEDGFAGHCLLVFRGVKSFEFAVRPYENKGGTIVWGDRVVHRYAGQVVDGTKKYCLGGGLHGSLAYVSIELDAQKFEIHLLDSDEIIDFS